MVHETVRWYCEQLKQNVYKSYLNVIEIPLAETVDLCKDWQDEKGAYGSKNEIKYIGLAIN